VLVPNHATLRGRDAVRAFFKEMIDAVGGTTTLEIIELDDAGDWAYQWLNYTLEAETVSDSGRVIEVLRRQSDGSWKIHLSIFNSDRAAP
jgi:ketosteroid isomerase-like protein